MLGALFITRQMKEATMTKFIDFYGRTNEFLFAYTGNFTSLLKHLQKEGSENINHPSDKNGGHTSAHFACYGGSHPSILHLLKQHGADLFQKDYLGRPPLFVAANAGKKMVLEYLLNEYDEANRDTTEQDLHKRTAIHAICSFGSSPTEKASDKELAASLELLLNRYPSDTARQQALEQEDIFGLTPVQLAIASGYTTETKDLKTGELTNTELTKIFLKYGINPTTIKLPLNEIPHQRRDFFFRTELMYHAFAGSLETVQSELAKGRDPNESNPQFGDRNALHLACGGISGPEFLRAIMQNPSINIEKCDSDGSNVLMFAANTGRIDLVETLLNGINLQNGQTIQFPITKLNDQDKKGYTALHAAAMASSRPDTRIKVINLLILSLGIDTELKDISGKTALQLAEIRNNQVVINAITEAISARQLRNTAKEEKSTETTSHFLPLFTNRTSLANQAQAKDAHNKDAIGVSGKPTLPRMP